MKHAKTEGVVRFTVSVPQTSAKQLDRMTRQKGYDNRSLAVADMIRDQLVEHHQNYGDRDIADTITLVYDHHKQHVQTALTDIQHDHHDVFMPTLHVHLHPAPITSTSTGTSVRAPVVAALPLWAPVLCATTE